MKRDRSYDRTLAEKRKLCGLTQYQVAQQSGVSLNRLVFAETGRIVLEPEELERVKTVFRERAKRALIAVA